MELSSYFWDGFRHFCFGILFVLIFNRMSNQNHVRNLGFVIGLIIGSSALFFLPLHISSYGSTLDRLYQFLHYPLPDWDILLLGINWHRFFLTHSFVIPVILAIIFLQTSRVFYLILGICIGVSSHLIWDGLTCSMKTPIVFISTVVEMKGSLAKGWLISHGIFLLGFALYIGKGYKEKLESG